VKGLWFVWGRLQLIKDSATPCALKIAIKLGKARAPRLPWLRSLVEHVVFLGMLIWAYQRFTD